MSGTAPKVGFVSLGCPKNLVDSERILTQLRAEGYTLAPSYEDADLVVVNTCGFIDAAVEESLRLEPAAANVDRYATVDVDFFDASIRAGDYVIVSLAGANRDPDVFDEPDRFRLDRPNVRQHTAFALGPHACLGIHIARAQTAAAIAALLELNEVTLNPQRSQPPRGLVFRKPPAVTATWTRP